MLKSNRKTKENVDTGKCTPCVHRNILFVLTENGQCSEALLHSSIIFDLTGVLSSIGYFCS